MELNKAVLDCMQALRRRLRDELAVDIRLSQPDAVVALLGACLRSSDPETRSLGQRLAEFSDSQDSSPASAKPLYRGHTQAEIAAPPALSHPSGSVRIYRGQRVYA
jgi:hypothetical protein